MAEQTTKICNKCKIQKDINSFSYRNDRNTYRNTCKDCVSLQIRTKRNEKEGRGYRVISTSRGDDRYSFDMNKVFNINKYEINKKCKWCSINLYFNKEDNQKRDDGEYTSSHLYREGYCSKWCLENDNPPEIKHICKFCGNVTAPIINSRGMTKGYRRICNSCISKGKGHLTPKIAKEIELDKTLDL